jgi:hypothetical protein
VAFNQKQFILLTPIIQVEIGVETVCVSEIKINEPVSALFLVPVSNIENFYHFGSDFTPFLYLALFSKVS